MSQNQEIIESKLCAYIDGELDPEGRAEIEKHLEANPQHRRLLESLRATRDLIRWLPREPAPPEVAETLNGQLERSVLLNDEGDSLRISPWPRIMAAAAIVLLTAGLAVAVYYALPRSQKPAELAFHSGTPDSTGDVVPAPTTPELARNDVSDLPEAEHGALREMDKMKAATPEDLRKDGGSVAAKGGLESRDAKQLTLPDTDNKKVAELDQLAVQVGQDPAAYLAFAANGNNSSTNNAVAQMASNSNPNSNAMVLLVRSDAPERTQKQLTSYLNEQQIHWRQAPLQVQAESLTKDGSGTVALNRADVERMRENAEKRESNRRILATTQPVDVAKDDALSAPAPSRGGATTQPAQPENFALASARPPSQAKSGMQNLHGDQRQAGLGNNAAFNGVYVCQMSRRQAAELSSTIGNDPAAGTQVQDVNAIAYSTNVQQAATQNSSPSESARARNPVVGGYGAGGTAGIQQQQQTLNSTLADRPNLMARQSIDSKAAQRDEAPTTRPADAPAAALNSPPAAGKLTLESGTTQPAGAGAAPAGAATLATEPSQLDASVTTAPADEPVNVVIMVQPNATTPAAAPPATQPSGQLSPQKAQETPSQPQPASK